MTALGEWIIGRQEKSWELVRGYPDGVEEKETERERGRL
jgi:hypothetical protein